MSEEFSISIHALCEEGDLLVPAGCTAGGAISIHALCEEGDFNVLKMPKPDYLFLSTPSARRATPPTSSSPL